MTAAGDVTLTATDSSEIDALSFGVAGTGGAAGGITISVNTVTNTIDAAITGSTVASTSGALTMDAHSSEIIRSLALGISGSGGLAIQVTAMGNAISNHVLAQITDSTVTAYDSVAISAEDEAPSAIPTWIVPSSYQSSLNSNVNGSSEPTSILDCNILAVVVSIAGTGGVAVNGVVSGNVIANTVRADIIDSTVLAGYNASRTLVNTGASAYMSLSATSANAIMALTVGIAGSGAAAINATGFGNVIANTIAATISGGSTAKSGYTMALNAEDQSRITSAAASIAGSGAVGAGVLIGANVIGNTVEAEISGSTAWSDSTLSLDADSEADILSFSFGAAGGTGARSCRCP